MDELEIAPAELKTQLKSVPREFTLVDVREYFELGRGVLPGAVTMPMSELLERRTELAMDWPVICYCEHGVRSYDVAAWLGQQGYSAKSMSGGFAEWDGPIEPWQRPAT